MSTEDVMGIGIEHIHAHLPCSCLIGHDCAGPRTTSMAVVVVKSLLACLVAAPTAAKESMALLRMRA